MCIIVNKCVCNFNYKDFTYVDRKEEIFEEMGIE